MLPKHQRQVEEWKELLVGDSYVRLPGFQSCLYQLLVVGPWACYLTSVCLGILVYKVVIIAVLTSEGRFITQIETHTHTFHLEGK